MRLLSRDSDYAVRALCLMAKKRGVVSASEIADELKIPEPFMRKILQILGKKDLLESIKGKGGGFRLKKSLSKIALKDLIEALQGPIEFNRCLFKKKICPDRDKCVLKNKIDSIENDVARKLESITLASLV